MQSMVNQGELDGLELLQGIVKDLNSYNTAEKNHKEQGNVEKLESSHRSDPILIGPSPWDEIDEAMKNVDGLTEAKTGEFDGLKEILDDEFSHFR